MDDKKTMNPMNEDALNEVAGGANYDFYGNPINNGCMPIVGPATIPTNPVNPGLSCSIKNGNGGIKNAQASFNFNCKVNMTGSVYKIDCGILP